MRSDCESLLLVEEVAREMRATVWAVRRWIREGKLSALRVGRRLLIPRRSLDALLSDAETRVGPRPRSPQLRAVPTELDRKRAHDVLERLRPWQP
jgi:excisionase family DNA binding protein